jgi:hypothetical protein
MRVRHRIPSIFNLSMVDVLCCALGCVILLWLINLREAKNHEDSAAEQLLSAQREQALAAENARRSLNDRDSTYRQLEELRGKYLALVTEQSELEKKRAALALTSQELEEKLKAANTRVASLDAELAAEGKRLVVLTAQVTELKGKLSAAEARGNDLQAQASLVPGLRADLKLAGTRLAAAEARARDQIQEMADAKKVLQDLLGAKQVLQRDLANRDKELALARTYKDQWSAAEVRATMLEKQLGERVKELAASGTTLEALRNEKASLLVEAMRLKAAADNRFAGIALTGRRVVFLVDMSGSMELVDEKTPAPAKWTEVCGTVSKVMRSLPNLAKYQVILFSDRATFALGNEGQWIDYDPRSSADKVFQTLTATKPKGGTNMYTAMEAAFKYRASGLDTIYLLSDGLPNLGAGVPPETARVLSEVELGARLSRHIRNSLNTDWNSPQRAEPRVRINTIGFFYESPDIGSFLWALARENDGSFVGMSKP